MGAWIAIPIVEYTPRIIVVAPYMGAWIEISPPCINSLKYHVAPYMGAWIEIYRICLMSWIGATSHPTWVRGLKSQIP